jgi:hypothetical protein
MRRRSLRTVPLAFLAAVATLAGCGDSVTDAATTRSDDGAAATTTTTTTDASREADGSPADAASVEQDIRTAYERVSTLAGARAVEAVVDLVSARCVVKLGLDRLTDEEIEQLASEIAAEPTSLVDVTSRRRTAATAQVELITSDTVGQLHGVLEWVDVTFENGHWRSDDCDGSARFVPVGESIGVPTRSEPTDDDEQRAARAVEAAYLGSGPAEAAWDSISRRCRMVEWQDSFDAFRAAHETVAADRTADPIDFEVVAVDLVPTTDDHADAHVTVRRDGARTEVARPLPHVLEGGRWRDDSCTEPQDAGTGQPAFVEVGEAIGG